MVWHSDKLTMVDMELQRINMLNEKIGSAMKLMQKSEYAENSEIQKISDRIEFLYKGFNITLEEYKIFGDKIKIKIKNMREKGEI